jgi:hypothetical protein
MTSKVGLVPLPFAGGYYRERSRAFNDKRLINWQVSYPDEPGINEYSLVPCPGIRGVGTGLFIGVRGSHVMNGNTYVVAQDRLYRIDEFPGDVFAPTEVTVFPNFISDDGKRVLMASIKNQLVIVVPGVGGYHYTEGGSLVPITSVNFLVPSSVVALDTYFTFSQFGTNVEFSSALNDGLTYSALDRYIVSQIPVITGQIVYRNQLYVLGEKLIVPFSNQSQAQFAFRPIPSAAMDYGLETRYLSINVRQGIVFVGRTVNSSLSVWFYSSGAPVKLSTPPIDFLLNKCSDAEIEASFLMQYAEAGTECVTLTFYNGTYGYCFVYDFIASAKSGKPEWHERREYGIGDNPWSVASIINCYRKTLVFLASSGEFSVGVMDDSIGTEFGANVRRVLNTQPYSMLGVKTKVKSLEIYTDVGVDDNSQITISWSDDGGFNYGNKLSRSTGAIGEYNTRVIWDQLGGFSRQRMLQIEYTGEYPRSINKLMANIE